MKKIFLYVFLISMICNLAFGKTVLTCVVTNFIDVDMKEGETTNFTHKSSHITAIIEELKDNKASAEIISNMEIGALEPLWLGSATETNYEFIVNDKIRKDPNKLGKFVIHRYSGKFSIRYPQSFWGMMNSGFHRYSGTCKKESRKY